MLADPGFSLYKKFKLQIYYYVYMSFILTSVWSFFPYLFK